MLCILFSFRCLGSIGQNSTQKSVGRYGAISMGFSCYPGSLKLLFKQSYVQISVPNFLTHYFISCFQSYTYSGQNNSLTFNRRSQETPKIRSSIFKNDIQYCTHSFKVKITCIINFAHYHSFGSHTTSLNVWITHMET